MESRTGNYDEGSSPTHQQTLSPPEWVIDICNHLQEKHLPDCGEICSISRVPTSMRKIDEDNYIPQLVSIGPFHHNNPSLQAMEAHKLRFLYGILDPMTYKTNTVDSSVNDWRVENVTLDGLERAMKKLEMRTRECYSEKFDALSSDVFVQMMLLDGCFIVELLRLYAMMTCKKQIDQTRFTLPVVRVDLLRLENQLPLFVLRKLYMLTGRDEDEASFNALAINFFNPLAPGKENIAISEECAIHLLALFQSSFHAAEIFKWDSSSSGLVTVPQTRRFGSATRLRDTGILFEKKKGCSLEIELKEDEFKIPPLLLEEGTTQFLRNAVAYEQCDGRAKPYFTTLVLFFNALVDSPRDVELLRRREIIQTLYSINEAADVIHNLTKGIVLEMNGCYDSLALKIEFNRPAIGNLRRLCKAARQYYFQFAGLNVFNVVGVYLSFIQTLSSVYPILNKSKSP